MKITSLKPVFLDTMEEPILECHSFVAASVRDKLMALLLLNRIDHVKSSIKESLTTKLKIKNDHRAH